MLNIGSFILLFLIFNSINKKTFTNAYKSLFVLTIVIELLIERGYFVQIGSVQIAYRTICELILGVISLVFLYKHKMKKSIFFSAGIVFIIVVIGLLLLHVFPSGAQGATMQVSWDEILVSRIGKEPIVLNSGMYTEIIQLLLYLLIIVSAVSILNKDDFLDILQGVISYSKLLIVFNCIEIITKYLFHSNIYTDILNYVLGSSYATLTTLVYRGNGFVVSGFTKEASHFAFSLLVLFILSFIYFYKCRNQKYDLLYFGAIVLNFFSTMSFSTIYFGACAILFITVYFWEKRGYSIVKLYLFIIGACLGLYILLSFLPVIAHFIGDTGFWGRRINSVVEELSLLNNGKWLTAATALEWSNRVRIGSTYETIKLMAYRPVFGLGFAATSAHSSLAMLLSGTGVIGSYFYLSLIFKWPYRYFKLNTGLYANFIVIFLFSLLLNSLGLRPFYEVWNILLAYSFAILSSKGELNDA